MPEYRMLADGHLGRELTVWTNGNAIRKYTGQDKFGYHESVKSGKWYKAKAIIVPIEEESNDLQRD